MRKKRLYRVLGLALAGMVTFSSVDLTVFSKTLELETELETEANIEENELTVESMLEESSSIEETAISEESNIPEESNILEESAISEETAMLEEIILMEESSIEESFAEESFAECASTDGNNTDNEAFTVFLNANGGDLSNSNIIVYSGETYGELPVPERVGYEFDGWFTDLTGGNLITDDMAVELDNDITIYAHWTIKQVTTPVANIETGSWINEDTIIYLSSETPDAKIYYTTDGTEPLVTDENINGKLYIDGIKASTVMSNSGDPERTNKVVRIKAYAIKEGNINSDIVTFEYDVEIESTRWGDIIEEDRKLYATEAMPEGDASLVPSGMWVAGIDEKGYMYSGNKITFTSDTENEIRVYDGKKLLKLNQDYTISYKNNKNAYQLRDGDEGYDALKAPSVTMKGKGNYSGSITETFVINPIDLSIQNDDGTAVFKAPDITLSYNGKIQKGTTKVTYINEAGKTITLKAGKDFIYTYPGTDETADDYNASAFKDASETPYKIIITGKGNYTGTLTFYERITSQIPVSKLKISSIPAQKYKDGEAIEPLLTIKDGGKILNKYDEETGTGDYTLKYENNTKPGTASIVVTGKGSYAGTCTITFKINGINIKDALMEGYQKTYIYTGDKIKQDSVKFSYRTDNGTEIIELKENEHYTVKYTNNKKTGTATVIYTGINDKGWTGSIKKTFKISPYDLNSDTENRITVTDKAGNGYPQNISFVKGGTKPLPVIKYISPGGQEYILTEGIDYKLSYINNKKLNDGTNLEKLPTIKITGKGNFKGTRQKENFKIINSDISQLSITALDKVYKNKKGNFTTSVIITDTDGKKLKAGTDYENNYKYFYYDNVRLADGTERESGMEVSSKDIVPVGTVIEIVVTGKGVYAGNGEEPSKVSGLYRIVGADISKASVKVNKQYYTGKEVCPGKNQIVITLNNNVLNAQDYEIVSYANNINKGTAKITVKGVGNYGGVKTVNFTIANKSMYYMISFCGNGSTSGSMKDMRLKFGEDYTLTKNTYKKRGYTFKGWNTEPDGSGTDAEGNIILYTNQAKNPIIIQKNEIGKTLILYAQWEITNFKIKYELDGGTNHELNPTTYTIEDKIILREPTRAGYNFLGWYTDSQFSESNKITTIKRGTSGNLVLYAKWVSSAVEEVKVPDEYLDVRDFGVIADDNIDDTNAIEHAIWKASDNAKNGGINTVYLPAGTYKITPGDANKDGDPGISLKSNVNLIMDNKAILMVNRTSFDSYCVISAKNVENITIQGGKIQGERYIHSGNSGEWGHGIALYGARNVEISNVSVSSNWGDGIYLGTQAVRQHDGSQLYVGCKNIKISNCDIFDNRRNNISVTDADDLTIAHCYIYDAHGTAPQCGIDIEPNSNSSGDKICRNIVLKDTTISAYKNKNEPEYMCFMTHHNPYIPNYVTSDGIWFKNCKFNGYVGNYSGNNLHVDDKTVFNGTFDNYKER